MGWASEEFKAIDPGDKRLNKRAALLAVLTLLTVVGIAVAVLAEAAWGGQLAFAAGLALAVGLFLSFTRLGRGMSVPLGHMRPSRARIGLEGAQYPEKPRPVAASSVACASRRARHAR